MFRQAGAIILGKTVTTELATRSPGKTKNPLNPEHTPGGSSSGSAAAVRDGQVPLALGTQTGGSVIRPASFCGIYGFKPSFGLIDRDGMTAQAPSVDHVGCFARSLADIAAERGVSPVEAMLDIAVEHELKVFFRQPISNHNMDEALAVMKHPRSCITFSDSGAHVSQIMDSSLQTHLLSYWVRDRQAFTLEEAVRKMTTMNAAKIGTSS